MISHYSIVCRSTLVRRSDLVCLTSKDLLKGIRMSVLGFRTTLMVFCLVLVAHLEGAIVFEKHVTLNRTWKGTDHAFSLTPEGFRKFVRDIKRVKSMFAEKPIEEVAARPFLKNWVNQ